MTESDLLVCAKWYSDPDLLTLVKVEKPDFTLPMIFYCAKIDNVPVGTLELFNIDADNGKAEFGLCFIRKGVAGIATKMFLREVFQYLNRVYVRPLATNEHSITSAKRFGFKQEGIERQTIYRNGEHLDRVILSMLKEEFNERWG
jgi:RimJ/RimL family protein N-acetyltransferase